MDSIKLEPLISSLGKTSLDGFYFMCAYAAIDLVRERLGQRKDYQEHLNLGLKAAYITRRVDVTRLLLGQGADERPMVAAIGFEAAQEFVSSDEPGLQSQYCVPLRSPPPSPSSPSATREQNELRLQWLQLRPANRTVSAVVEGVEGEQPTALHLQAQDTRFTSAQRIAWMQFDLERFGDAARLDRIADIRNVQGTPLHWVVDDHGDVQKNREVLAFLLERGANPTVRNNVGQTPREMCLEQLELPVAALPPERREFYVYAHHELAKAEQKYAAAAGRGQSTSLFSVVKSVFGWT